MTRRLRMAFACRRVADFQNEIPRPPARQRHGDFVIPDLPEQGAGQRRVHADQALVGVKFIRTDEAVFHDIAGFIFQPHPGAEIDTRDVGRGAVHDFQRFEPLAQKAYAPVNLAQLFFAVDVFGVLRAVALGRGLRYRLRHPRPLHAPQLLQLFTQTLRALRRDVGRAFGGWKTVSAHGAGLYPAGPRYG